MRGMRQSRCGGTSGGALGLLSLAVVAVFNTWTEPVVSFAWMSKIASGGCHSGGAHVLVRTDTVVQNGFGGGWLERAECSASDRAQILAGWVGWVVRGSRLARDSWLR